MSGSTAWFAVCDGSGNLISTGTSVADAATLAANGYTAVALAGNPAGQVWNASTKTFAAPPAPSNPSTVTALAFAQRFQPTEYAAIEASTDPEVRMFMLELGLAPGGMVTITSPTIQAGLAYLVTATLLTQARATAIGTP